MTISSSRRRKGIEIAASNSNAVAVEPANPPSSAGTTVAVPTALLEPTQSAASADSAAALSENTPRPCQGPILVQSSFDAAPAIWAKNTNIQFASYGGLSLNPFPNLRIEASLDLGGRHDVDACAIVRLADGPASDQGGLAFSIGDTEILFLVDGGGEAEIAKYDEGTKTRTQLASWQDGSAITAGFHIRPKGQDNRLAVRIVGGDATFWVNGTEVASVGGAIPLGPLTLSLYASAFNQDIDATWQFGGLTVAALPHSGIEAAPADIALLEKNTEGCSGEAIVSDSFGAPLPKAVDDPHVAVADGKLTINADADKASYLAWGLRGSRDVDACATVAAVDGSGGYAGLDLAAGNVDVLFLIDPRQRRATVYRRDNATNAYSPLVADRKTSSVFTSAENRLHVRLNGDTAVFYINGVAFGSTKGALPAGPRSEA